MSSIDLNRTTFLLGSGVSLPSGLPSTATITSSLLSKNWLREKEQKLFGITLDSSLDNFRYAVRQELTNSFIRLLQSYVEQYAALHGHSGPNYEDIYYLAKQMHDSLLGEYENPALLPLFFELRDKARLMTDNINVLYGRDGLMFSKEDLGLQGLIGRTLEYIEESVAAQLCTPAEIKGFKLLEQLLTLKLPDRLNVISLNHDLLLESYFKNLTITDGFIARSKDIDQFSPASFEKRNQEDRILLLKPHGSINWFYYQKGQQGIFAKLLKAEPNRVTDMDGHEFFNPTSRLLLAGTTNKELSYGSGIFLELFYQLQRQLHSTDLLVVSGYGFRDKGINNRIWHWLELRTHNRLIVLHENIDALYQQSRPSFAQNFKRLKDTGKLVVVDRWLCDATVDDLERAIRERFA